MHSMWAHQHTSGCFLKPCERQKAAGPEGVPYHSFGVYCHAARDEMFASASSVPDSRALTA
eukprot:10386224-Alexandrium_andersonii.AAC.1